MADAIRIDQSGISRRIQHVSAIGTIYKQGYSFLVYLGDAEGHDSRAVEPTNKLERISASIAEHHEQKLNLTLTVCRNTRSGGFANGKKKHGRWPKAALLIHIDYDSEPYARALDTNNVFFSPTKECDSAASRYIKVFCAQPPDSSTVRSYPNVIEASAESHEFAVTKRGLVCLVTTISMLRDCVCVFLGGLLLFVLREGLDVYMLVGVAYVDGMVQGETFELDYAETCAFCWGQRQRGRGGRGKLGYPGHGFFKVY